MDDVYTPAAARALERASSRARRRGADQIGPRDLLAALVDEPESRACDLLEANGLDLSKLAIQPELSPADPGGPELPPAPDLRAALGEALHAARAHDRSRAIGTEHLLLGLVAGSVEVAADLSHAGVTVGRLVAIVKTDEATEEEDIPLASEIGPLDLTGPEEHLDLGRILDASANRAGEGLRVIEDYVRFVLDDPWLTRRLKDVRHRFGQAVRGLDPDLRLQGRDTANDVGTHISTPTEQQRENPRAVLSASFRRVAEALRSLEEYTKLSDVWLAGRFEVLRYDSYVLEKRVLTTLASRGAIGDARLYVLVGGLPTLGDLTWVVGEALEGGAQVIQLREKDLPDRLVLERAREVRILTGRARARFVLNDRPDLALLAGADGVHLGQEDLALRDARRVLGPQPWIGVSTHDRDQLDRACAEGATYLGVGPVFTTPTKSFEDLAGMAHVRLAAETCGLPWFAIGGITLGNLDAVLEAGARRIAVSAAVVHADRPRQAAQEFRDRLDAAAVHS